MSGVGWAECDAQIDGTYIEYGVQCSAYLPIPTFTFSFFGRNKGGIHGIGGCMWGRFMSDRDRMQNSRGVGYASRPARVSSYMDS